MKKTVLKGLATCIATYAIGMLTLAAVDADAAYRRIGPQFCHASLSEQNVFQGEYFRNSESVEVYAFCGVPDDSTFDHTAVTWLSVQGYQQPGSFAGYSNACAKYYNGWGSACGPVTYFPNYVFNSSVSVSAWQANPWTTPYIGVALSPGSNIYSASLGN